MPALLSLAPFVLAASSASLSIGTLGPDFRLTPIEGDPFGFAQSTKTHAAVVLVFFSVVCPYSNYADDHLRDLDARYRSRKVLFVGIDSNRTETVDEVAEHARNARLTFPMVKDTGNQIADLVGAKVTPEAFVFDADGRLRYRGRVRSKIGSTDLKAALDAVLEGRPVKIAVAKAFGCTIVRE